MSPAFKTALEHFGKVLLFAGVSAVVSAAISYLSQNPMLFGPLTVFLTPALAGIEKYISYEDPGTPVPPTQ